MPMLNKLLTPLFILIAFSTSAQADIVKKTCQFSVEYSKITFQHPDGCATKLIEKINVDDSSFFEDVNVNKEYVLQHHNLAQPEVCGSDFKQIQPIQFRIVSQIHRNYRKGTDNALYETIRYCAYEPS